MNSQKPLGPAVIDVSRLMEVICGFQKERYPFERYVSLLTFSTWLSWPAIPEVVHLAEIVAAGRLMLAVHYGGVKVPKDQRQTIVNEIAVHAFTPLEAANAVANPCLEERFTAGSVKSLPALFDVAAIVAFFLKCPLEMRPGLNKALFFIDEGGLADDFTIGDGKYTKPYKVSQASLRSTWSALAISSPFCLAAERLSMLSILALPPDSDTCISIASKLYRNVPRIKRYFGIARYIQESLLQRLDKISRDRFAFVNFPETVAPHPIEPHPFDEHQLQIIKKYRAPKFPAD